MFTGIIESVGRVASLEPRGETTRMRIHAPALAPGTPIGASVAVNGTCLTVTEAGAGALAFDAVKETLDRSALGDLAVGARVNLERALRADGRFDGHIVQGHVDTTGRIRSLERQGEDVRLAVDCDPDFAGLLIPKGSVTVDGVALTLVHVERAGFDVALIPHTLRETNLGDRAPGDRVNLEGDVLGKYVLRYLERVLAERDSRRG
ncbi:MAG TPA: riboflavin synthase [Myxococcota bacterium]|nr:riboflavin synthase [Myxococcota bacterium]